MYLHSQQNEGTVPHPFFLKFLDEHQIFGGVINPCLHNSLGNAEARHGWYLMMDAPLKDANSRSAL